jgi:hypothetical protein
VWRHPAAAGSAARPAFPWWQRGTEREEGEKGERKKKKEAAWPPDGWVPHSSDSGPG